MRDYIILNGKRSTLIKGLMIQSLPPIRKPALRTQTEEIDGRDGDIITPLGYAAYDKEVEIGLYGDFDIDEVIGYFNSSGKVTFSNEIDKFYNYQILKEIDFEKLIRYRTATAVFHVQPFKFSLSEHKITHEAIKSISYVPTTIISNGLTVKRSSKVLTPGASAVLGIELKGTCSTYTEIYCPINSLEVYPGSYVLNANANGTGSGEIRLISNTPSNADSFGGQSVSFNGTGLVNISATINNKSFYDYIYFQVAPGTVNIFINFIFRETYVGNPAVKNVTVYNSGNIFSKPTIRFDGNNDFELAINGVKILDIALSTDTETAEWISINAERMEAYNGNTLKNRKVTGDYSKMIFQPGENVLTLTGDYNTKIEITNYSRWL